jgi:hypothetical protein
MMNVIAYIDPGTGAIVLQVIVAGILTTGVVFRRYVTSPLVRLAQRTKLLFRGGCQTADPAAETGKASDA